MCYNKVFYSDITFLLSSHFFIYVVTFNIFERLFYLLFFLLFLLL